jgi:hypothetical protein
VEIKLSYCFKEWNEGFKPSGLSFCRYMRGRKGILMGNHRGKLWESSYEF